MPSEQPFEPQPFDSARRPQIGMIWAQTQQGVIGYNGEMPWRVPEDLKHFREITTGHPVVMGRRTWESFPPKFRPLPHRTNIVVSRTMSMDDQIAQQQAPGSSVVSDFQAGMRFAVSTAQSQQVWVIGGSSLYEQALDVATVVERTVLDLEVDGDTYAPELDPSWQLVSCDPPLYPDDAGSADPANPTWHTSSEGVRYRYERWERHQDDDD